MTASPAVTLRRRRGPLSTAVLALSLLAAQPIASQPPERPIEPAGEQVGPLFEARPRSATAGSEPGPAEAAPELPPGPAEAAETGPEEPGPDLERIRFEVPFASESGGGVARGSAGTLEYERTDLVVATGAVELLYGDLRFQGDKVTVDLKTKKVFAEGQVILDQGPRRLTGETLDFDLETKTGKVTEGKAFVDPDIYFTGAEIEKIGDDVYMVKDGMMTSCTDEVPDWSFRLGKARVNLDGFARIKSTRMRVKKLPLFYLPYLLVPANRDRQSGLLFPNIGYSSDRGYLLGLAYYQTFGDSYDATLFADLYGEDYLGAGAEFRYAPSVGTNGIFQGYAIDDPIEDTWRWKAILAHSSDDLPWGLRGIVQVVKFSDFNFFRDFERDFNNISIRRLDSTGFVSGNWGSHSFNLLVQESETFINSRVTVKQQQLPEVEYQLRSTQLGSLPLYLGLSSAAHFFRIDATGGEPTSYQRADVAPSLTLPLSYLPWLSVSVTGGGRSTWYSDSVGADGEFTGDAVTRTFPTASAQMVGPVFSRIFEGKVGRFGKFKHIIEPRWSYSFIGESEQQSAVPLFDEIDILRSQNFFVVGLVNRLLAKPADPKSLEGAREILSLEISQAYSLDEDQPFQSSRDGTRTTTDSAIVSRLRFNPGDRIGLEARASYSTLFGGLESTSLSGGMQIGRHHGIGLTWFTRFDAEEKRTTTHQARLGVGIQLVPNRLRVDSSINYDLVEGLLQQHRHLFTYTSQCFGLLFELRENETLRQNVQEFRFAISLKNIGTFLDLNSGSRTEL